MPNNYTIDTFSSNKGLNITPISAIDSFSPKEDYNFQLSNRSSLNNQVKSYESNNIADQPMTITGSYNSTSGYGSINAAAAVAKTLGQDTFADVADLGGNNSGADFVKAPEVWQKGYTGQGIVVAVVDTGVDYNHEDLKDNIWTNPNEIAGNGKDDDGNGYIDDVHGWNFVDNNNDVLDRNGHGTHVSGTIAGENNGIGVTGVAYDAKIMPVKVMDDSGSGSFNSVTNGIYYAVDHGARVINLSLGGSFGNSNLESAIEYASSKGAIVVMAAGNNGSSRPGYPASYAKNYGLAVGAVDKNNNMADFSNRAGSKQIAYVTAPGVDVYSTLPGNQYASYNGTSMASPHVAGVVALMLSANKNLTDAQTREIITQTAANNTKSASSNLNTNSITESDEMLLS